jgi:hypothetical protein
MHDRAEYPPQLALPPWRRSPDTAEWRRTGDQESRAVSGCGGPGEKCSLEAGPPRGRSWFQGPPRSPSAAAEVDRLPRPRRTADGAPGRPTVRRLTRRQSPPESIESPDRVSGRAPSGTRRPVRAPAAAPRAGHAVDAPGRLVDHGDFARGRTATAAVDWMVPPPGARRIPIAPGAVHEMPGGDELPAPPGATRRPLRGPGAARGISWSSAGQPGPPRRSRRRGSRLPPPQGVSRRWCVQRGSSNSSEPNRSGSRTRSRTGTAVGAPRPGRRRGVMISVPGRPASSRDLLDPGSTPARDFAG